MKHLTLLMTIFLLPFSFNLLAEDSPIDEMTVKVGNYRHVNFWHRIEIGTAAYFNPEKLYAIQVDFIYNVKDFILDCVDSSCELVAFLYHSFIESKSMFATVEFDDQNKIYFKTSDDFSLWISDLNSMTIQEFFNEFNSLDNIVFVSVYPRIGEIEGRSAIIRGRINRTRMVEW